MANSGVVRLTPASSANLPSTTGQSPHHSSFIREVKMETCASTEAPPEGAAVLSNRTVPVMLISNLASPAPAVPPERMASSMDTPRSSMRSSGVSCISSTIATNVKLVILSSLSATGHFILPRIVALRGSPPVSARCPLTSNSAHCVVMERNPRNSMSMPSAAYDPVTSATTSTAPSCSLVTLIAASKLSAPEPGLVRPTRLMKNHSVPSALR
mmetsp:Transcript_30297/g.75227  ORF Transcript_30297/g.75227 Transcript_30297/m.75227 type:complete len:213 (-) Transcript_30297:1017-1655(-)